MKSMMMIVAMGLSVMAAGQHKPHGKKPGKHSASRPASQPASQASSGGLTPIKSITKEKLKKTVTVEAAVQSVVTKPSRTKKNIHIHTLKQDGATIEAVWWDDLSTTLKADQTPKQGDHVRITGEVGEFRGKLQIQPKKAADIRILK